MPQGAAGAPAWLVSVMRLVTADVDNIRMYLDAAFGSDDCPIHHVATLATFFARLRLPKLKLSPDKSRIGAARVDVLGHVISADDVRPNDDRVAALTRMPMPTDITQLRSLLGGLSYYRKFLPNMARRIRICYEASDAKIDRTHGLSIKASHSHGVAGMKSPRGQTQRGRRGPIVENIDERMIMICPRESNARRA